MVLEAILFFVAAALALGGAVGVVVIRSPFFSVLALVSHLVALATLFLLLDSAFVAAAQVVVYAGAVMVLYVFVVAYIGGGAASVAPASDAVARLGPLFALALFVELSLAVAGSSLSVLRSPGEPVGPASAPRRRSASCCSRASCCRSRWPRAAARGRRRRGGAGPAPARPGGGHGMSLSWYVLLSALIFCTGAAGVLTRRNPLVVLLCLELMLNAANLALVAFGRMHGSPDGHVFALVVMVVAACEVVIGLGLIVAMYRRHARRSTSTR